MNWLKADRRSGRAATAQIGRNRSIPSRDAHDAGGEGVARA